MATISYTPTCSVVFPWIVVLFAVDCIFACFLKLLSHSLCRCLKKQQYSIKGCSVWEPFLGTFERYSTELCIQNTLVYSPHTSPSPKKQQLIFPLKLCAEFVLLWQCLWACLLGNRYGLSLKIVSFHVTFVLCCCSQAENMPTGVLITHILALSGLASGSSFKSTQQQNIFIPCFPL